MKKSQQDVIKQLKNLFDIDSNQEKGSYELNGKFGISKEHMDRFSVISELKNYFNGVIIEGGYLKVAETGRRILPLP